MAKNKKRKKSSKQQGGSPQEIPLQKISEERKRKKQPSLQAKEHPNWLLIGLAAAGMILTAYLFLTGWLNQAPVLCKEGGACDIVQQSRWGTFLGLPTAFWGFLTYATLLYIVFKVRNPNNRWKFAWTVSLIGWGYSIYLITISTFVIQAMCFYCIASFSIMTALFGVLTIKRPKKTLKFNFPSFARQAVVIVAIFVGGMHLHYSGVFDPMAGPEDPYLKGLAVHLVQEEAILYGAYW